MVIEAVGVEQYAFRPRSIPFAGHGLLFRGDKEVGAVPCLAIGRDREGKYALLHCDSRWSVRGAMSGYETIREVEARAERFYPGISRFWRKTGYSRTKMRTRLREGPRCSICSKPYYEIEQMVEIRKTKLWICNHCIVELHRLIEP